MLFLLNLSYCLKNLIPRLLGAVVVIAANSGGAWTPIGDVTTTMLWIHGQISTLPTMKVISSYFLTMRQRFFFPVQIYDAEVIIV